MSDTKYCNHCERPIIEIGQCGCDKSEIERLKAELSNESSLRIEETQRLQKELLFEINANEEKGRRIEELNEVIAFLDPPYGILEVQDQLDEANEHIEELEEKLRTPVQCPQCDLNMGAYSTAVIAVHHITDKQINAAVEWAELPEKNIHKTERWYGLNYLGIVRCEGCAKSHAPFRGPDVCPGCKDKGWVIGCA